MSRKDGAAIRSQLRQLPGDSGYGSLPSSRKDTSQIQQDASKIDPPQVYSLAKVEEQVDPSPTLEEEEEDWVLLEPDSQRKYPGLILEPESAPISKDQLAAEVKGIYAGLVMVESKCINIDSAQAADPNSQLGPEQWKELVALHRTLLYEHHDFLMATQHPSATLALRGLANKYLDLKTKASTASFGHNIRKLAMPEKRIQRPRGSYPTVPGWINGKKVDPLGDSGASHNYVSEAYARRNGYAIDTSDDNSVKLANSSFANILGSTTLSFRFKNDARKYDIKFKVLRNCIHDLILGASFLRLTETFTRFKERIKWRLGNIFRPSVNFVDDGAPQQYIIGSCNGTPVVALPDTGCQVLLVSERHAEEMGYDILRQPEHKIKLELADGSVVETEGMVKNIDWSFDNDGTTYRENFYVLKDLACDVILSCDFVCDTQTLESYPHLIFEGDLMDAETQANLNVIKIIRDSEANGGSEGLKAGLKSLFSRSRSKPVAAKFVSTPTGSDAFERAREALLDDMEEVDSAPANKHVARQRALDAEYRKQMKTHPTLSAKHTPQTTTKLHEKR